jgi:hypothetical protein
VFSLEIANANFIILCLTWSGIESTIFHIRFEHAYNYITESFVSKNLKVIVYKIICNINTHFPLMFYAVINLKIVNFYKPWSNMKILMLFHDFDVISWFCGPRREHPIFISVTNHIYHESYSWTYLSQIYTYSRGRDRACSLSVTCDRSGVIIDFWLSGLTLACSIYL